MRLTILLSLVAVLKISATGYSQATKFSIDMENVTLRDVFKEIEKKTDFAFFYNDDFTGLNSVISIDVKNGKVEEILAKVLESSSLTYHILENNFIVIAPSKMAQRFKVTGTITDENGAGMPGVNVTVAGTTIGVTSDANGKYSIDVPEATSKLVISFVGYLTETIDVQGRSVVDLKMSPDVQTLDEVVVIGYGSVKKSDLTGAVTSVSAESFGDRSSTGIGSLLQGKAAGVEVTGGTIRVRGVTTINNTDPLYVIDGYVGGDMGTVHPSDIQSIEILKDASATAIYGARGANGVILVTTKKGKAGAPKVELNAFWSVSNPAKQLDMLNSAQYMDLLKDIELNGGTKPSDLYAKSKLFNPDGTYTPYVLEDRTDWQNEMFQQGNSQEYTLSVRGGTERAIYSISGAYNDTKSTAGNWNWKGYKFGANAEWKFFKDRVKVGENFRMQYWNNSGKNPELLGGLRMPPYSPIRDENALGGFAYVTTTNDLNDAYNPATELNLSTHTEKGLSFMGNIYAEVQILKDLTFNSNFGLNGGSSSNFDYNKKRQNGNLIFVDADMAESFNQWIWPKLENYLTYKKTIGKHDVSLMAGNTVEQDGYSRYLRATGKGFINDEVPSMTKATEKNITDNSGGVGAYLSYFGRFNYVYNNKYLLTLNYRADASPNFAPSYRWGKFPSIAVGWKLHEEEFMKNISWLSQLKLRAGYGTMGNDNIGQFKYYSRVHSNVSYAFPSHGFGSVVYNGSTINTLASPVIKWEETKSTSFGADLGFMDNKLEVSADYFFKDTYDILFGVPQPPSLGMGFNGGGGNAIVNAASAQNRGVEFNVSFKNQSGDFKYQIMANATFVNNEVTSLGSGKPYNAGSFGFYSSNRTEVGQPIGYFYGFQMDKVYVNQADVDADNVAARAAAKAKTPSLTDADLAKIYYQESSTSAGDVRFVDLNGDGKVNDDDRKYIGNAIPKANFGFTATAAYKGFDFYMGWTGVYGNSVLYEFGYWMEGMIRPFNATTTVLDRWKSPSQPGDGRTPRAVKTDPSKNLRMSDRFIYDGSYLRLNLLSIGYTLPKNLITKISNNSIDNLRVYVSSDNLLTISDYPGYNPEIGGSNTERGRDTGTWPTSRSFRFGLQLNF